MPDPFVLDASPPRIREFAESLEKLDEAMAALLDQLEVDEWDRWDTDLLKDLKEASKTARRREVEVRRNHGKLLAVLLGWDEAAELLRSARELEKRGRLARFFAVNDKDGERLQETEDALRVTHIPRARSQTSWIKPALRSVRRDWPLYVLTALLSFLTGLAVEAILELRSSLLGRS